MKSSNIEVDVVSKTDIVLILLPLMIIITAASTATATTINAATNKGSNNNYNYCNNNVIIIKIIITIKIRSHCVLKKSSYLYCSPHFLFGKKMLLNSVSISVKVICSF